MNHDHFAILWAMITHDHILKILWFVITIMRSVIISPIILLLFIALFFIINFFMRFSAMYQKYFEIYLVKSHNIIFKIHKKRFFLLQNYLALMARCGIKMTFLSKLWSAIILRSLTKNMSYDHSWSWSPKSGKNDLQSLMIVIWLEMIGDHDQITLTLS